MLEDTFDRAREEMGKAVKSVVENYNSVRTGRASTALVEGITADYYGTPTPINQLAKIQVPDAKQILIEPYDPDSTPAIEKGIMESDLGLTPNSDGNVIRINIPDLTEERRKELSQVVNEYAEEGKIAIRKIRREARDEVDLLEEEGEISEDDAHRARKRVQELTDEHEEKIEQLTEKKIDEIMTV